MPGNRFGMIKRRPTKRSVAVTRARIRPIGNRAKSIVAWFKTVPSKPVKTPRAQHTNQPKHRTSKDSPTSGGFAFSGSSGRLTKPIYRAAYTALAQSLPSHNPPVEQSARPAIRSLRSACNPLCLQSNLGFSKKREEIQQGGPVRGPTVSNLLPFLRETKIMGSRKIVWGPKRFFVPSRKSYDEVRRFHESCGAPHSRNIFCKTQESYAP